MMERLTKIGHKGYAMLKGSGCNYSHVSFDCQVDEGMELLKYALEKLAEYEDLEEQGLLLKLPCKVGSTVYHIANKRILEVENVDVFFLCLCVAECRFGKTVFLTQAEAEQKLKEMESD